MNIAGKIKRVVDRHFLVPLSYVVIRETVKMAGKKGIGYGKVYPKRQVVCVATTIPKRISTLHLSIQSILCQTIRPHKVVIYLGRELFDGVELTDELKALEAYGVEFRYVHDVRVHTKYYYAFQDFPDSYVMTFDDDILYHPKLLEYLLKSVEKNPGCVVCSRAHRILGTDEGFAPYEEWRWEDICTVPTHQLLPTGVGGVLYQPSLFDNELYDEELFLTLAQNNDDLWLKYIELKSRIPSVTLKFKKKRMFVEIDGSQVVALNSSNVYQNKNNIFWENLMTYANMTYKDLLQLEKTLGDSGI